MARSTKRTTKSQKTSRPIHQLNRLCVILGLCVIPRLFCVILGLDPRISSRLYHLYVIPRLDWGISSQPYHPCIILGLVHPCVIPQLDWGIPSQLYHPCVIPRLDWGISS